MDLVEKIGSVYDRHPWETARLKVIFNLFKKYQNAGNSLTILDIGCGDVYIAEHFAKKYPTVNYIAVDIAFDANKIEEYNKMFAARNINNVALYSNITDIYKLGPVKADCIFLFDVIEHIENELDFIKQLLNSSLVSMDTNIFISVPAYQCLFTSHDTYLKHYRRYNNHMLKQVAKETGLSIVAKADFFSMLLLPRILKVMAEKLANKHDQKNYGIGHWKSRGFIDKTIVLFLYTDYLVVNALRYMGIKLPGLSKFMICKKSA
jgi:2-polyprenyl-3-methyl-5-hydroxy-6-metoxy-1,4-benzoquinol methylase